MNELLRDIENTVLDNQYQKFEICYWKPELSLPILLKVYDSIIRDITNNKDDENNYLTTHYTGSYSLKGLSHCCKWILQTNGNQIPNITIEEKEQFAVKFIGWGIQYHKLVLQHVAFSRNMSQVIINETDKIIEFTNYFEQNTSEFIINQHFSQINVGFDFFDSIPKSLYIYYENIIKKQSLENVFDSFDFGIKLKDNITQDILKWLNNLILPSLSENLIIGKYQLSDLQKIFAVLFVNSYFIVHVDRLLDTKYGLENRFGSVIIELSKSELIDLLFNLTEIEKPKINSIIMDLTFDYKKFYSSIMLTPLLEIPNNKIILLPRLVSTTDINRIITNILTTKYKKDYDKIINQIEPFQLEKILEMFNKSSFTVYKELYLTNKLGQSINPDFIIINEQQKEILVIDYKHFLSPINVSDVINKINEIESKEHNSYQQIDKYIDFLQTDNFALLNKNLNLSDFKVFAILLIKDPMPIPIKIKHNVVVTDLNSFKRLDLQKYLKISEIIERLNERMDILTAKQYKIVSEEIMRIVVFRYVQSPYGKIC